MGLCSIVKDCWNALGSFGRGAAVISLLGLPLLFGGCYQDAVCKFKPKDFDKYYTKKRAEGIPGGSAGGMTGGIPSESSDNSSKKPANSIYDGLKGKEGNIRTLSFGLVGKVNAFSSNILPESFYFHEGMISHSIFGSTGGAYQIAAGANSENKGSAQGRGFFTIGDSNKYFIRPMVDFHWNDFLVDWHGRIAGEAGFSITGSDRISAFASFGQEGFSNLDDILLGPAYDDYYDKFVYPELNFENTKELLELGLQYRTTQLFPGHISVFDVRYSEFRLDKEYYINFSNYVQLISGGYERLIEGRTSGETRGVDFSFFTFAFDKTSLKVSIGYYNKRESRTRSTYYMNPPTVWSSYMTNTEYDVSFGSFEPRIEFRPWTEAGPLEFIVGGGNMFWEMYGGMTVFLSGSTDLPQLKALNRMESSTIEEYVQENTIAENRNFSDSAAFRFSVGVRAEDDQDRGVARRLYLCGEAELEFPIVNRLLIDEKPVDQVLRSASIIIGLSGRRDGTSNHHFVEYSGRLGIRVIDKNIVGDFMLFTEHKEIPNLDFEKVTSSGLYLNISF